MSDQGFENLDSPASEEVEITELRHGGVRREYNHPKAELWLTSIDDYTLEWEGEGESSLIWTGNGIREVAVDTHRRVVGCKFHGDALQGLHFTISRRNPENWGLQDFEEEGLRFEKEDLQDLGEEEDFVRENNQIYKIAADNSTINIKRYKDGVLMDELSIPKHIDHNPEHQLFDTRLLTDSKNTSSDIDHSWRNADPFGVFGIKWIRHNESSEVEPFEEQV